MSRDSSTSFHDKNTQKLEKNFTNLIQIIFLKIAANIILNSKMLSFPPLRSGTRQGYPLVVVVVQSLSCVQLCDFSMPGLQHTRLHCPPLYLLQFVQTAVKLYNHLILCRSLPLSPSIIPSLRLFSNESALRIRWPKYWSFSFSIVLPMNTQDWSPLGWAGWISLQNKTGSWLRLRSWAPYCQIQT